VATWAAANGYDIGPADGEGKASNRPVYHVSWYEAMEWAKARSEREGLGRLCPGILRATR
jgi:formylglycine-generating enzyme required for sulfatase activity